MGKTFKRDSDYYDDNDKNKYKDRRKKKLRKIVKHNNDLKDNFVDYANYTPDPNVSNA